MIFKRFGANLRAQNWSAILIEFAIVVSGVYLGVVAADWSAERASRAATLRLLQQFKPELYYQFDQYQRLQRYLSTTTDYAKIALAGWKNDPKVDDRTFVIAAYQASQASGSVTNTQTWANIFGAGQVQNIRDLHLRTSLIRVLSIDSALTDYHQIEDAYRVNVRRVLPNDLQERIRKECGDQITSDAFSVFTLPPTCNARFPEAEVRSAASALRAHPELVGDLNWHQAAVASMLDSWRLYVGALERLSKAIDRNRATHA